MNNMIRLAILLSSLLYSISYAQEQAIEVITVYPDPVTMEGIKALESLQKSVINKGTWKQDAMDNIRLLIEEHNAIDDSSAQKADKRSAEREPTSPRERLPAPVNG